MNSLDYLCKVCKNKNCYHKLVFIKRKQGCKIFRCLEYKKDVKKIREQGEQTKEKRPFVFYESIF